MTETKRERAVKTIADLENQYGQITPEDVVGFARPIDSPLHGYFTWDDEAAAHGYRVEQARTLIRSIRYEVTMARRTISTVRYVHDERAERDQGYVSITRVNDAGMGESTVQAEITRTIGHIERGRSIAAALGHEQDYIAAIRAALK